MNAGSGERIGKRRRVRQFDRRAVENHTWHARDESNRDAIEKFCTPAEYSSPGVAARRLPFRLL